jgi:glycosyltransferase involved in cell wall biosynthesis
MPNRDDILALIPAYNEARHVADVIRRTLVFLPTLVVDDGSTDGTGNLAADAGAEVVRQSPNAGKGVALLRGLRHGLESGYRAVVTLDADGQHLPEEIPRFLDAHDGDAQDLIIGYRDFRRMPPLRRFANGVGTWLLGAAIRHRIRDNQSGFRLLSARFIESLDLRSTGFEMEVEMIVQAATGGFRIGWVPISTVYADEVSHFNPLRDSVRFLSTVLRAARRAR